LVLKDFGVEGEWSFFLPTTQLLPSPPPIESKLHLKCWELGKGKSAMFFLSGRPVYGGFVRGNRPKVKNQRQMVKAEAETAAEAAAVGFKRPKPDHWGNMTRKERKRWKKRN
jgi:hypothetical protein